MFRVIPNHARIRQAQARLGRRAHEGKIELCAGALLSVGDLHAAQGDGELSGTAIECSMTGTFQVILHKKGNLAGRAFADLSYPLIETETDWVLTGSSNNAAWTEYIRRAALR